jgi:methyl-accepting chemotaxis protein
MFLRFRSRPSSQNLAAPAVERDPLHDLLAASSQWPNPPPAEIDPRISRALETMAERHRTSALTGFGTLAKASAALSRAAVHAGWIGHDMGEVIASSTSIAGAVEELAANSTEMARSAEGSTQLAAEGQAAAAACRADVHRVDAAITAIAESSNLIDARLAGLADRAAQIAAIAATITKISGQTNLLALNATIEAARA